MKYVLNVKRLNAFESLQQFLSANSPDNFSFFETEAKANKHYHNLVSNCTIIEEKYQTALSVCSLLNKKEQVSYLLSLENIPPEQDRNLALRMAAINLDLTIFNQLLQYESVQKNSILNTFFLVNLACTDNKLRLFDRILDVEPIRQEIVEHGNYYLELLSKKAHPSLVQRIFEFPSIRQILTQQNCKPFMRTIESGSLDNVRLYLTQPEIQDDLAKPNSHALRVAIAAGRLDVLNRIIFVHDMVNKNEINDITLLHLATKKNNQEIISRLLQIQAIASLASQNNEALCKAIRYGSLASLTALLDHPAIYQNAAANHNQALTLTVMGNHIRSLQTLLTIPSVWQSAHIHDNYILKSAINHNHTAIALELLNIPHVRSLASNNNNHALNTAVEHGNGPLIETLLSIDHVRVNVSANHNRLLRVACKKGFLNVVNILLCDIDVQKNITIDNNEALYIAAKYGRLSIVQKLLENKSVEKNLSINSNEIFKVSLKRQHLDIVDYFLSRFDIQQEVIANSKYYLTTLIANHDLYGLNKILQFEGITNNTQSLVQDGLCLASDKGQSQIVERLMELPNIRSHSSLFNNLALTNAVKKGHQSIVKCLLSPGSAAINANLYNYFMMAIREGHLSVVKELLQYDQVQESLSTQGQIALREAICNRNVPITNMLLRLPEIRATISKNRFAIYWETIREHHATIIPCLLNIPHVFEHASNHLSRHKYHEVSNFMGDKLSELEARKQTYESAHQHGMFDVDAEESNLLYYILKFLILRNNSYFNNHIALLLSIPKLTSILHLPQDTPGSEPNALLQLALRCENQTVISLLLNFPEVRRVAVLNNYYSSNTRGIDIRRIVQNAESSMMQFTQEEAQQLGSLVNKYQIQLSQLGGKELVFLELKNELENRYKNKPASISLGDASVNLPFSYAEFNSLRLDVEAKKTALQAYFKHPDHSAFRFLSKPNPWIHPQAEYVVVINRSRPYQRSADYDYYISMICCFWLAACDASEIGPENYSIETRKELFIRELAGLARSHNWDKTKALEVFGPRNEHQQNSPLFLKNSEGVIVNIEYDDGELDKPSCAMGIRRRIFQSLYDHPLFTPITIDHINEAMRSMAVHHFQRKFKHHHNLLSIKTNIEACIIEGEELSADVLALNLKMDELDHFIYQLRSRYREKFNIGFESHIKSYFKLEPTPSHIINLYETFNLGNLLDDAIYRQSLTVGRPLDGEVSETTRATSLSALSLQTSKAPGDPRSIHQLSIENTQHKPKRQYPPPRFFKDYHERESAEAHLPPRAQSIENIVP